ncbi:MAG TPA: DUF2268 domain-containing putative Zn-dependent protease [Xanthobacteraceae bacterium]
MNKPCLGFFLRVLASTLMAGAALGAAPTGIEIQTEDVTRFYKVYDAAGGHPSAEQLQRDYIDLGTPGFHHLATVRNVTAERIAEAIVKRPELYTEARVCLAALPRVRERLNADFRKLLILYPEAQKPPVTILVGRGRPLAISGPGDGVQIGLEAMCAPNARFLNPNVGDRFVHVIAHEYVHSQQSRLIDDDHPTVLERSLLEGAAEFIGEMISGDVAYGMFRTSTKGREKEIETKFAADVDKTDLSDWLDNTTPEKVGDLGYWVGYRIVQSYYQKAPDKRAALHEIIRMSDPNAFLTKSGWYPGIVLK